MSWLLPLTAQAKKAEKDAPSSEPTSGDESGPRADADADADADAGADVDAPRTSPTSFEGLDEEDEPSKKKKKKKDRLEFRGRLIARAELGSRRATLLDSSLREYRTRLESLDLSLPSARVGFRYQTPIAGVSTVASLELTGRPSLKDGYVQAKTEDARWGVRAGQFKLPGSPFETASRLSLPSSGRGFIHDLLTDRLEIGGRRPGLAGFAKLPLRGTWALELTLGAFQGSYLRDPVTRDRALLNLQALGSQTAVARVEAALDFLRLGWTGNYRVGSNVVPQLGTEPEHFWSTGIDAFVDAWLGPGGLRVWADFNIGESWFVAPDRTSTGRPLYTAARGMVAFRGGGRERGQFYVEPFVMAGMLDPDAKVTRDWAMEALAGVGVGYWERGHLTLQGGLTRTQRYFPASFIVPDQRDQKTLILQAGVQL